MNIGYKLNKWILDSGVSHHYVKEKIYFSKKYKPCNITITTAGREILDISSIGTHNNFGEVKLVKYTGRKLLPIRQMTKDPDIRIFLKRKSG